jgi:hypothetical protein
MTEMSLANVARKKNVCWYLLVLSWIKCYIISNKCLFIYVDFRCLANHMQMLLGKKMVIGHYGYWHFLSTANTTSKLKQNNCMRRCVKLVFYISIGTLGVHATSWLFVQENSKQNQRRIQVPDAIECSFTWQCWLEN